MNLSYAVDAGRLGQLRVGANNLTDEDPAMDPSKSFPATSYIYDYTGRVVFAEYRKTFD